MLTPEDFTETPEKGVILQKPSLRTYFKAYEAELTRPMQVDGETLSFRHLFRRQAERLARCLVDGEPYRSFRWTAD